MTHIELPRALEDYFAYAETDPTRNGRRFTISLPYFQGTKLDRLQWWYHLSRDQEQRLGATAIESLRAQATARFHRHIERWLENTGQRVYGSEPIPQMGPIETVAIEAPSAAAAPPPATGETPSSDASAQTSEPRVLPWPSEKVANG
ncbi:MAG TPA: hypothetical protein VGO53_10765 [Steroidobacteraceae bacterium]|nr:hypothetical protein [Steroidobacteraceae bacterium]